MFSSNTSFLYGILCDIKLNLVILLKPVKVAPLRASHSTTHSVLHSKPNNLFNSELTITYRILNESLTSATSSARIIFLELKSLEI